MMLSIVISVLNEEKSIAKVLSDLKQCRIPVEHEIVVIDDRSNDSTRDIVLNELEKNKKIRLISSDDKHGLGRALKRGFETSKGDIIVVLTGDLSDDTNDVPIMLKKICDEKYDIICASRYAKGGIGKQVNLIKGFFSKSLNRIIHVLTKIPTLDSTNSYKMFRKKVLKDIGLLESNYYTLGLELLLKAHKKRFKITEIPTIWRDRKDGKSHFMFLRDGFQYFKWFMFAIFNK